MKRTILGLAVLCSLTGVASASPPPQTQPAPSVAALPTPQPGKKVTFSFENADLVYVLRVLAKEMGRNIYIGPTVQGSVTIKLVDVPVEEALRLVLAQQQYTYEFKILDGPSIRTVVVAPPDKLAEIANDTLGKTRGPRPGGAGYNGSAWSPRSRPSESESYRDAGETGYRDVTSQPLSTFSIDVDTASYSNARRFLNSGMLPPPEAIRVEEFLNSFLYDYPKPDKNLPFATTTELSTCPWNNEHQLLRIGLQAKDIPAWESAPRNLVFLLDVSGSMNSADKLPLVKRAMKTLVETLGAKDHVAIVVYAGHQGLALPSTSCDRKAEIVEAIEQLNSGGSTNGSAGISLAYEVARQNFKKGHVNRVILCTDGDFNVGVTGGSLTSLIEKERKSGIYLTVLGFGTGNLKDATMEELANKGNGNYAYIDSFTEAQKILVHEAGGTLETVAKDVKVQIEFNPGRVASYRLIGYENRRLADEDFANDAKDAGELGAGHRVTALYEIVPGTGPTDSSLRYQKSTPTELAKSSELALVKLRYKRPDEETSREIITPITPKAVPFAEASLDMRFACAVTSFGLVLNNSEHKGTSNFEQVETWAKSSVGSDPRDERGEFLRLVQKAKQIQEVQSANKD